MFKKLLQRILGFHFHKWEYFFIRRDDAPPHLEDGDRIYFVRILHCKTCGKHKID